MPDTDDIELLKLQAELCKTFANPKRLFIIKELRHGEKSVGQLAEKLGIRPANVSQHLAILRDRGVVEARREATTIYYCLADSKIGEACDLVRQVLINHVRKNKDLADKLGI